MAGDEIGTPELFLRRFQTFLIIGMKVSQYLSLFHRIPFFLLSEDANRQGDLTFLGLSSAA